ncbi:MBOAT family O-acyltransferase [Steroidobacter agaridevorans]|uniref:MBOAT family O-acyltransferase n=1 Tax=Steroidobacter agaridevorans TaxID=2695856 RepID=UPI001320B528|nr:MBOAT family protein [Steroidobacter agaridevorans]GFE91899.1 alginate O-acetyltransferase [Steroidobacter agaridevorans]
MVFNSHIFIFAFLPVALTGYWLLHRMADRAASFWLLATSIAFYACASIKSLALVTPSILLDYLLAKALLQSHDRPGWIRTTLFAFSISTNIALLVVLKYTNFFLETTNALLSTHYPITHWILPLGISFLTFQKIAFFSDIHSGRIASIRFIDYLQFFYFFPRTIAGPISRYGDVAPQFEAVHPRSFAKDFPIGLFLFSIGLFKKAVIADSVLPFVSPTFDGNSSVLPVSMLVAWIGALAYTLQVYFDFSGYSDMALGVARMFGVRLPANFNSPFKSSSISEFWSRWHMSLTSFLTEFVYTPIVVRLTRWRIARRRPVLQGKRSTFPAILMLICLPMLITMLIAGIWHGAGWQFVVFGLMHGSYLMINQTWRTLRPRFWASDVSHDSVMRPLGWAMTFGAVVLSLVVFRAPSIASAWSILNSLVGVNGILPGEVGLLRDMGVNFPWDYLQHLWQPLLLRPLVPIVWIVLLLLCVLLLPNSLELLGRYGPALNFKSTHSAAHGRTASQASKISRILTPPPLISTNMAPGSPDGRLRRDAVLAAFLFTFGILALSRGQPFIYAQF